MSKNNEAVISPSPTYRLLKAEEVATILNVSRSFAYQLMKSGQLRTVRLGHSVRVHPADLEKYIVKNAFGGAGV